MAHQRKDTQNLIQRIIVHGLNTGKIDVGIHLMNVLVVGVKKEVGGHVIKEKCENDRKWYIIPLCKECNSPSNEKYFSVDEDYLVPVSNDDTSEYPNVPKVW